jgi:LruC domain-containing protein
MKKTLTLLILAAVAGMSACKKDTFNENANAVEQPGAANSADGFNFQTTKNVNVDVTLKSNNDQPIAGALVNVYEADDTDTLQVVFKGLTDNAGRLKGKINVSSASSELIIDPAYAGLMRNARAKINNNNTTVVIGGKAGFGGDIIAEAQNSNSRKVFALRPQDVTNTKFVYPAPYTSAGDAIYDDINYPLFLGVPKYMEAERDEISPLMLKYINNSLPESKPVMQHHPEYLTSKVVPTINVVKKSEVSITFVSEGASYQNTLAYYTYPTKNPPKTANDIAKATFLFPNASLPGAGGAIWPGSKIKLGTFEAGTTIAFIVLRNSWTSSDIQTDVAKFYSNDAFNPESDSKIKKHTVVLNDDVHEHFVIGFEDITRSEGECDNDFNDILFFAKSTVKDAIDPTDIPIIDKNVDTDGDGVPDDKDQYPNDPERAYDDYYPSAGKYAQLGFEDNWPVKGDYDMNDLVIKYQYKFVLNAQNKVVDLYGEYVPRAAGSSFKNGFGVQLPVSASVVRSVKGQKLTHNYITLAGNGTESGQSKAVIIPFDHQDDVIANPDGAYFVNTLLEKDKVRAKTITVILNFTAPLDRGELNVSDFNPFLIANLKRDFEVHLPGYKPTDKADKKLLGSGDDISDPAKNKYYISEDNLPWAVSYKFSTRYPIERVNINKAYNHFTEWAKSGGKSYPDWYYYSKPGYADLSLLYVKRYN